MRKYTLTFTDKPGSKARYRHILKMMGAESLRIDEDEIDPVKPVPRPDNLPTSEEAKAVAALFKRPAENPWADEEIKAFKSAVKTRLLTLENINLVAGFYKTERRREGNFCRTSLLTFLRHFHTELDKAKASKPTGTKALEWTDSRPKIVPMVDPAEEERIRQAAKEQAAALKEQLGRA